MSNNNYRIGIWEEHSVQVNLVHEKKYLHEAVPRILHMLLMLHIIASTMIDIKL